MIADGSSHTMRRSSTAADNSSSAFRGRISILLSIETISRSSSLSGGLRATPQGCAQELWQITPPPHIRYYRVFKPYRPHIEEVEHIAERRGPIRGEDVQPLGC